MLSYEAICRRAGGRRHYNKTRRHAIYWRLVALEEIFRSEGYVPGDYARWAARLGVSRSTICRDVRRLWNAHSSALVFLCTSPHRASSDAREVRNA